MTRDALGWLVVLLTGGAGYIGSHTALCLLNAGHEVVVLDNLSNASPEALRRVEELTGKRAPLIVGDCADEAAVAQVRERDYPAVLRGFGGPILLVGVTYERKSKRHTCIIEEV